MNHKLHNFLKELWTEHVKKECERGFLTYERQVQAFIYYKLKEADLGFNIFIEPVLYDEELNFSDNYKKIIPDIVITDESNVLVIIELKFKLWEESQYSFDIGKLRELSNKVVKPCKVSLGWLPKKQEWKNNNKDCLTKKYSITDETQYYFIVCSKHNGHALLHKKIKIENIKNFHHFTANINNEGGVDFRTTSKDI